MVVRELALLGKTSLFSCAVFWGFDYAASTIAIVDRFTEFYETIVMELVIIVFLVDSHTQPQLGM